MSVYEIVETQEVISQAQNNVKSMSLFEIDGDQEVINQDQNDQNYLPQEADHVDAASDSGDGDEYYSKRKSKQRHGAVWRKFTIVSKKHNIASCNICGAKLSFRSTTSNLKKHVERKHNYDINNSNVMPYKETKDFNQKRQDHLTQQVEDHSGDDEEKYSGRPLYSDVWTRFTVLNRKHSIASCNVCGMKLSFRGTITNLKKHSERKHNYVISKSNVIPNKKRNVTHKPTSTVRRRLTDLGGLDGLILNVVADEGEDPSGITQQPVEAEDNVHDYCMVDTEEEQRMQHTTTSMSRGPKTIDLNEKMKRNRITNLQLECLELKKYTMQMESLLLERQLNLPRSIHTENLRGCDNVTRGTQTDVGGGNTKVFYVSDNQDDGMDRSQHFFTFQARLHE